MRCDFSLCKIIQSLFEYLKMVPKKYKIKEIENALNSVDSISLWIPMY